MSQKLKANPLKMRKNALVTMRFFFYFGLCYFLADADEELLLKNLKFLLK